MKPLKKPVNLPIPAGFVVAKCPDMAYTAPTHWCAKPLGVARFEPGRACHFVFNTAFSRLLEIGHEDP
jgi:hypothetical protein